MNLHRLVSHDLRCGLLRLRYLFTPLITLLPCFVCYHTLHGAGLTPAPVELLMYCFKGQKPVTAYSDVLELQLPIFWLLLVGGCLFMNLDYLLKDLTNAGLQVITRSRNKKAWYLSKCIWNICTCALFFALTAMTVCLFSLCAGGKLTLQCRSSALWLIFEDVCREPIELSVAEGLTTALLLPFLTVTALSMIQMTLCLFTKPTTSFIGCMALLVVALFVPSAALLGNGAMTVRSKEILDSGLSSGAGLGVALAVIALCVAIGCIRFKGVDMIGLEE